MAPGSREFSALGIGETGHFALVAEKPDLDAGRLAILGMGDIATLLERAEEKLDRSKAEAFAKKALAGDGFSLEDFRDQLRQIKKLGSRALESHPTCKALHHR